jgi:hypothetical protein
VPGGGIPGAGAAFGEGMGGSVGVITPPPLSRSTTLTVIGRPT